MPAAGQLQVPGWELVEAHPQEGIQSWSCPLVVGTDQPMECYPEPAVLPDKPGIAIVAGQEDLARSPHRSLHQGHSTG